MLEIRVNAEEMTAETASSGNREKILVEAALVAEMIIYETAKININLARDARLAIVGMLGNRTVEEIVAELNAAMQKVGEENGRLS